MMMMSSAPLELPSNATSIRAEITDNFSCENRGYGYYADVENECQIFHVCLPVMYPEERKERTFRWSFICPEETVFSQVVFTCVRMEDMPNECKDSEQYYELNKNFGAVINDTDADAESMMKPESDKKGEENMVGDSQMMMQMVERIETTTASKVMEVESVSTAPQRPQMSVPTPMDTIVMMPPPAQSNAPKGEEFSSVKVVINPMDMAQDLLPPLSNDVYRVGMNGEAVMIPVSEADAVKNNIDESQLDAVDDLHMQDDAMVDESKQVAGSATMMDTKEQVIKNVENIIMAAGNEEEVKKENSTDLRRLHPTDPRRRRFLFKADSKRN